MAIPAKYLLLSFLCFGIVDGNAKEPKPLAGTVPATSIQILENKGQIIDQFGKQRKDIDFKIENGGVTMYGGKGQLHYQWKKEIPNKKSQIPNELSAASGHLPSLFSETLFKEGIENTEIEIYRLDVTLVGANPNAEVLFEEPTGYYENYYLPQCPDGATAKGYTKITYKNIYPNIDWVVYTNSKVKSQNPNENTSLVKYDFIIRHGGNPADIKLRYDGATDIKLADGVLTATTPFGTITENAPYSYESETKKEVISKYILNGNELRFDVGQYEGTLVIDPALLWATYFGNAGVEWLNAVDISVAGDLYACGTAYSGTNITTTGAYQQVHGGDRDGLVAKYTTGGQKVWVTYYGGSKTDDLLAIHTDRANNLFIAGYMSSSGVASIGSHQASYSGTTNGIYREDAFLLKMNPNGQRIWATYYGDTLEDWGTSVVCDSFGYVYLAGRTISTRNIATPNRHKTTLITGANYGNDGFIAKFDTSGNRQWGTYYGGFQTDEIYDIDAMADGKICVTGRTDSDTGVATPGTHQPVLFHKIVWPKAGDNKAFVAKLDSSGNRLWGTYLGNDTLTGLGMGTAVHFDETGNIYAGGTTADTSGIASMGVHQQTKNSISTTGYIVKLNPNGIRQWGSYYGGEKQTYITDITTGIQDAVYIYGCTDDTTGISTTGAVQTKHKGGFSDMFVARFNTNGQRAWGSYYGGTSQELGGVSSIWGAVVYQKHKVYFNFRTTSTGLATPGADKDTLTNSQDGMLVCMYADTIVYIKEPFTDTLHCAGDTLKLPYDISYHFRSGNVFTVQMSDSLGNFTSPVNIGSRTDSLADTIVCIIPRNTPSGSQYRLRINAGAPGFISEINTYPLRIKPSPTVIATNSGPVCAGDTLKLFSTGTSTNVSYNWSGPASFTSSIQNPYRAGVSATDSGDYILRVTMNGCYDYDTTRASVKPLPATPAPTSNSPVCRGTALNLSATSTTTGVKFSWSGPNSFTDTAQNPTVNNVNNNHAGVYNVYTTLNGCTSATAGTTVAVGILTPAPVPSANSPLCARQDLQLTASTVTGANYNWYGPAGFTAGTQNPVRNYVQMNHAGKYYVYATINGCISDTDSVTVVVNTDPIVNIFPTPGTTICPGQQATFTAIPTNGGTAPSYQWRVNGIATVGTAVTYNSSTINNGDIVTCHMTSTTTCSTPFTDTSNAITMTVLPKMTPSVTISANPNTSLHPNEPINFTATPSQAGTTPTYQWRRNGKNIGGATSDTWGANANALGDGDEICVLLKSSYQCPDPDTVLSNCIKLDIRLGIVGVASGNSWIKVYPNPTTGSFTITSAVKIEKVEISNLLGQKLHSQKGHSTTMTIDMQKFAAGVYVIKVNDSYVERVVKE